MTPAACDFPSRAREFSSRYFREERYEIAVCHS
ncbi:hypothetical protein ACWEKM_12705 [Streptomyces sp. NPDC004752]